MKVVILLSILLVAFVSCFPTGPACEVLKPPHGVLPRFPKEGQFELTFSPPLDNGVAFRGQVYRVRIWERMVGFDMQVDNGEVMGVDGCTKTCNENTYVRYIFRPDRGCHLNVYWTPDRRGLATLKYTIVWGSTHDFYPNLSKEIRVE